MRFPDDFIFTGSLNSMYKQIGNAVPPLLGKAIGKAISAMVKEASKTKTMSRKKTTLQAIKTIREKAFVYRELKKNEIMSLGATQ